MSNRRRRADDFTNSLSSFRQTIHEEEQDLIVSQRDKLDNFTINNQHESDKHLSNNESCAGSIIISGNLDSQQYILSDLCKIKDNYNIAHNNKESLRVMLNVSDETSYLSLKPDLNKCINLFRNEHLNKESCTIEDHLNLESMLSEIKVGEDLNPRRLSNSKNVEVQCNLIRTRPCAMSLSSLQDATILIENQDVINMELKRSKSCSMLNSKLKRDTNYNIKANYFSAASTTKSDYEKTNIGALLDALSLPKPSILPNQKSDSHTEEDQKFDSINSETSSKEQLNSLDLKAFLHSLDNEKPSKETVAQERLLRRMSANYYTSPKTFTEKLLTIIEESIINESCAQLEYPEVSLCRLTEELRKTCKFIEDETIPEWPQSPNMLTSICAKQKNLTSPLQKSLIAFASRDKGLNLATTASPRRNIKSPKKACQYMPKGILYNMKNPLHDSTSTFESLEAFCEKWYADEDRIPMREKNSLQSPLKNIENILHVCESQMASLENSPDIREQLKKAATSDLTDQCNSRTPEAQYLQYKLLTHGKHTKANSKKISDAFKQWIEHNKSYEMIEPDDLETTLMYEIAKKRQRCLDTAKVMMEIDTNLKPVEHPKQTCPDIVISEASPTKDAKFMETLMSVKRYQEYLEKHKPILNYLQTESCSSYIPEKKGVRKKKVLKENVTPRRVGAKAQTLEVPKLSRTRKKSPSPTKSSANKTVVSKPRLFVTPGKTPVNKNCKPKRTYFPNLMVGTNKGKNFNVSPHPKSIYRQIENYDHVVSPVGMYIKGTDSHLVKNLRPKTDEMLLTPRKKKQTMPSPSPKPKMKFQLSPKQPRKTVTKTAVGDENVADNFLHPKVHYKLPLHVHTIKETEKNLKVGNRVNELLRSTRDKVVIRHEGRIKSVQTDCSRQPEIHYDSAEESVHIEQTARKTCFSRVQKN